MARINFVVSNLLKDLYSGGIWCIFEYANGLVNRGHDVSIVPTLPTDYPRWFPRSVGKVLTSTPGERRRNVYASLLRAGWAAVANRKSYVDRLVQFARDASLYKPELFSDPVLGGIAEAYVMDTAPDADITIATSYDTVRPASLLKGKKYYFAQHYEPYFAPWTTNPVYAAAVATQSYGLDFTIIANSSWLLGKMKLEHGDIPMHLCTNAIDHTIFYGEPKHNDLLHRAVVISYAGRDAVWKGFKDMAEAISIARAELPTCDIEWRVYGDTTTEAHESNTSYVPLGFLFPTQLSEEYRKADILLSASWYESFPLFPIEAMACGLPAITTRLGTEDYATDGVTAQIVQARSPRSIADGITKLIQDRVYREKIATAGNEKARQFCWERSIERFESLLLGG